jgi:RNA polymerase sigma factor (sigma-70 family)
MRDDRELLRQYVDHRSEGAFAELVERHLGLVYSAVRRMVHEPQATEDIVQAVFIKLARKAATLEAGQILAGWLYRTASNEALAALRAEKRRHQRETTAMTLAEQDSPDVHWEQLAPLLEEAMAQLSRIEQDAVLLRFFEGKTLPETGQSLALSEEAARKRVDRALEKLRFHFARYGIATTAALLASGLGAHAAGPAPAGLAAKVAGASVVSAAGTGGFFHALGKLFAMSTKTKTTLAATIMLVLALIPLALQSRALALINEQNGELAGQNAKLQAEADQLKARIRDVVAGATPASGAPAASDYLLVDLDTAKEFVQYLQLDSFNPDRRTTNLFESGKVVEYPVDYIQWLALTPDEVEALDDIFTTLNNHLKDFAQTHLQEISLEQAVAGHDPALGLDQMPGSNTAYLIPPMSTEETLHLREWFYDGLIAAVGPERAAVLFTSAEHGDFGLHPGDTRTFIFADTRDANGKVHTQLFSIISLGDGHDGYGGPSEVNNTEEDLWMYGHFPGPRRISLPSP